MGGASRPPGKNTGVGCHFLLQCMKVKSEREVDQSCPTLRDPMDCSPPGSSIVAKEYSSSRKEIIKEGILKHEERKLILCPETLLNVPY